MRFFQTWMIAPLGVLLSLFCLARASTPPEWLVRAAHTRPTPAQLAYHQREFIAFIHFGVNTFTGREWGSGKEDPMVFQPVSLDTDQWCRYIKAAGMTKVVITVKHHDGFCLWQTRYNDTFSVRATSWRDGKGDVLTELSRSCRKFDLKLGVYLSPADLYQIENEKGLYGNQSPYRDSVIPTDPASFKTDPTRRRRVPEGLPTFRLSLDDYNRYFMNQLYELLTEYGPIHEVWFDGAHPKRKGNQQYVRQEWYQMIRVLVPDAVIFGGPDVRWCGNERGYTRQSEWNVIPLPEPAESYRWPDMRAEDLGSRAKIEGAKYLHYFPAETNTSIRGGWFWRNDHEQPVRSPEDVFDIYERAVGGNSVFLLNIPPNAKGLFSQRDADCLVAVGQRIRSTYGGDLARDARFSAANLQDNDLATYWQPAGETGQFTIHLPESRRINRVVLQEAIGVVGQRVENHAVDVKVDGQWHEVAAATTIGYKRILRFATVLTDQVRIRVTGSRLQPTVAECRLHYDDAPPLSVAIARDRDGRVSLTLKSAFEEFSWKPHGQSQQRTDLASDTKIHFTLDGGEPTAASPLYHGPFALPDGGVVKVRSIRDGKMSSVYTRRFGLAQAGYALRAVSSEQGEQESAAKAIDGDSKTFWHTSREPGHPVHPHHLVIDLGRDVRVAGVMILPRQDRRGPDGMIEKGRIEISADGRRWRQAGEFEFGNLLNDPTGRTFLFARAIAGRYVKLVSLRGVQDGPYAGAAEIEVLVEPML